MINRRFDAKTTASLLGAYLEVVRPVGIKGEGDMVKGINGWEAKVQGLRNRYNETLSKNSKLAILIGMLPREYQKTILETSSFSGKECKYEEVRD